MYNVKSKVATEFIDDGEIMETLEYAEKNKSNRELIESLLEKGKDPAKGLSPGSGCTSRLRPGKI